ncbi:MAG: hypothetical protein Q9180_006133 [Flavoplaca navasiana]
MGMVVERIDRERTQDMMGWKTKEMQSKRSDSKLMEARQVDKKRVEEEVGRRRTEDVDATEQKVLIENALRSKGLWMLEYRRYAGAKMGANQIGQAPYHIRKLMTMKQMRFSDVHKRPPNMCYKHVFRKTKDSASSQWISMATTKSQRALASPIV